MENLYTSNNTKSKPRNQVLENASLLYNKVPPQVLELEEIVLGAMMSERGASEIGLEYLKPECFYLPKHATIFEAMLGLMSKKLPIDLYTLSNELKSLEKLDDIGGVYFLSQLTTKIASTAHTEAWAKIIVEKYVQRELIRMSSEVIQEAYDPGANVFELINAAESKLFAITNNFIKRNYQPVSEGLVGVMNRISEMKNQKTDISGIHTGYRELDLMTNGWQNTDLIIVAARPGLGKTAFALNLARNAALHTTKPTPVAFFSLEMSTSQLIERMLSAESEIALSKIKKGKLDDNEMMWLNAKGVQPLSNASIFIDDTNALNIFELRSKAKKLVANHGVKLIIIDYLQIMSGTTENRTFNREQEISKLSRELKSLAKELDIPIIVLSQLNRNSESRGGKDGTNKRPMLSDLRESGAIEQDADMVILLYREDYYKIEQNEMGENVKGLVEVDIAKHRNGESGVIKLKAKLDIQKFFDWEGHGIPGLLGSQDNFYTDLGTTTQTTKLKSKMKPLGEDEDTPPF